MQKVLDKLEHDALGNLVKVTAPPPGGGTAYETVYKYSELGQLLTATMTRPGMGTGNGATVTQTRTWVYNSNMQLVSVRHPESSTVANPSTRFDYNADGTLNWKQDAKNQKVAFTYDTDGRVTAARRYHAGGGEDTCARVDYY
ncbi:MAG: hypothetical protein JNM66_21875, partial [Bryobacterales bacterium]|nr:hypothetical protein [Bryobacterales bacterium]